MFNFEVKRCVTISNPLPFNYAKRWCANRFACRGLACLPGVDPGVSEGVWP